MSYAFIVREFYVVVVVLAGLRKHEEAWVFEEPVTEAIAPGYFEVVDKPMDYTTVEKKVEEQVYKGKDEVRRLGLGARASVQGGEGIEDLFACAELNFIFI